jgi:lysyl-tRNA synthetase class 2
MPSTAIRDIEYDDSEECLTVTFVTGRVYVYFDVPIDVAADFHASRSKGTFFNTQIRDRYRYREITQA